MIWALLVGILSLVIWFWFGMLWIYNNFNIPESTFLGGRYKPRWYEWVICAPVIFYSKCRDGYKNIKFTLNDWNI